jgi:LysR family cys regulon transcriptional activator
VFAPVHHPLLREKRLTLESIARYPIITFDPSFEGGRKVLDAFARHDIPFTVAMTASDVAVIKLYLELDIGVAILPTVAFEPARDRSLRIVDASRLFESTVIHVLIRRHHYLRRYILDFLQMLAPHWKRSSIEQGVPSGELVDMPIKTVHGAADIMLS